MTRPIYEVVQEQFSHECAWRACVRTVGFNHAQHYGWQCLVCGMWRAATKEQKLPLVTRGNLLEFDAQIREGWCEKQRAASQKEWLSRKQDETEQWFVEHNAYLQSAAWETRRRNTLKRDQGLCKARLPGCLTVANQVHHLTYAHWRNEPLFDLISVCSACHEEITTMDREQRGA